MGKQKESFKIPGLYTKLLLRRSYKGRLSPPPLRRDYVLGLSSSPPPSLKAVLISFPSIPPLLDPLFLVPRSSVSPTSSPPGPTTVSSPLVPLSQILLAGRILCIFALLARSLPPISFLLEEFLLQVSPNLGGGGGGYQPVGAWKRVVALLYIPQKCRPQVVCGNLRS